MSQNLFSLSEQVVADPNRNIVSFKAGKCTYTSNTITCVPRKGLVQVVQSPDGLVHFQWKDRTSSTTEDDLIIFPGETSFQKIESPAGRVYLLKFTTGRKLFFWLQEPKTDKDAEYEQKVNSALNGDSASGGSAQRNLQNSKTQPPTQSANTNPQNEINHPPPSSSENVNNQQTTPNLEKDTEKEKEKEIEDIEMKDSAKNIINDEEEEEEEEGEGEDGDEDLEAALALSMNAEASKNTEKITQGDVDDEEELKAALAMSISPSQSSSNVSNNATTSSNRTAPNPSINSSLLQSLLEGMGAQTEELDLEEVLSPTNIAPILNDPNVMSILIPLLPETMRTQEELLFLPYTPQFQQALNMLCTIVANGHGSQLLTAFGLDSNDLSPFGGIKAFVEAIQKSTDKKSGEKK